jgi:hypothetical protein
MNQSSGFKRNNLAFFVLSRMRLTALLYGLFLLSLVGCNSIPQDPVIGMPTPKIAAIRFDSAFFAMDSLHFESDLAKLVQAYPQFSADYFNRILMRSSKKRLTACRKRPRPKAGIRLPAKFGSMSKRASKPHAMVGALKRSE